MLYAISHATILGTVGLSFPATSTEVFLLLVAITVWAAIIIFITNQTSKRDVLTRPQKVMWGLGALIFPLIAIILYFVMKPGQNEGSHTR